MNYIGKNVYHEKYGNGVIISQNSRGLICVRFSEDASEKRFSTPACFKQFLTLLDEDAAAQAAQENRKIELEEEKKNQEEKQKAREQAYKDHLSKTSNQGDKGSQVPRYTSVGEFCEKQEHELSREISYIKKNGGKRIKLLDGRLVFSKNDKHIYSFDADSELYFPDCTPIKLWPSSSQGSISGMIENCEEFTVLLSCERNIGKHVLSIEMSADPWRILQSLIDRLHEIRYDYSALTRALICNGLKHVRFDTDIRKGQDKALEMSMAQPITFIWGPPGTGKTESLAIMALEHMNRGEKVLMLSHSNVSVDGAILRVLSKDKQNVPGKLIRYGYPRDKEVLHHEFLSSYDLALSKHPGLEKTRNELRKEKKRHQKNPFDTQKSFAN